MFQCPSVAFKFVQKVTFPTSDGIHIREKKMLNDMLYTYPSLVISFTGYLTHAVGC